MKTYRIFMRQKTGSSMSLTWTPDCATSYYDKYSAIEEAANLKADERYKDSDIFVCSTENGYTWTQISDEISPQFRYNVNVYHPISKS